MGRRNETDKKRLLYSLFSGVNLVIQKKLNSAVINNNRKVKAGFPLKRILLNQPLNFSIHRG